MKVNASESARSKQCISVDSMNDILYNTVYEEYTEFGQEPFILQTTLRHKIYTMVRMLNYTDMT